MKNRIIFLAVLLPGIMKAQDFHYTHFYQSPFTLNPALAGSFIGDIRVINNYRTQWMSVTSNPYKSLTASVDAPVFRGRMKNNDYFSLGFSFNNDKAGLSMLTTNLYNGAASFTKSLSDRITNTIAVGFMGGYGMRSISFAGLSWDRQYQNGYNSALSSGEPGGGVKSVYFDYAAGILWNFSKSEMLKMKMGASLFHFVPVNSGFIQGDKLYSKYMVHGMGNIKLGKTTNMSAQPAFELALQGPTLLINLGSNIKYVLQDRSKYTGVYTEVAVSFGGWYRVGDALMVNTRFDYGQFAAGVSYDINLSGLTAASYGRGGFEFLFVYTGLFKNGVTVKVTKARI